MEICRIISAGLSTLLKNKEQAEKIMENDTFIHHGKPMEEGDKGDQQEDGCVSLEQEETQNQIIQSGSVTTRGKHLIHCLTIIGQIEGHYILPPQNKTTKYEHIMPQLVAIEQDPDIEGLVIMLNTVGGDVEAGLAIAELVAGMKKPTVSLVLGGGHSIGVPLAVSAKRSFIVPSATMTIHPVRMNGLVLGVPQTLSYFDKMQERIVGFVTKNSRITPERFRELMMTTGELMMDVGTVLDGEQAVKEGLIDELGGLSDVINCLYGLIEQDAAQRTEEEPKETSSEKPFKKSSPKSGRKTAPKTKRTSKKEGEKP